MQNLVHVRTQHHRSGVEPVLVIVSERVEPESVFRHLDNILIHRACTKRRKVEKMKEQGVEVWPSGSHAMAAPTRCLPATTPR